MQIGQTIWAIDPCEMRNTKEKALTVGKAYKVIHLEKDFFVVESAIDDRHKYSLQNFDKYFSLTPPKEVKEGVTVEYVISEIERRQKLILSEPDGIVRETMINDLLIGLKS